MSKEELPDPFMLIEIYEALLLDGASFEYILSVMQGIDIAEYAIHQPALTSVNQI